MPPFLARYGFILSDSSTRVQNLSLKEPMSLSVRAATLQECGVKFFSVFLCQRRCEILGSAISQNLVVKFDGEIRGGVLVENASDNFPQQKKLENLLPNFAGSSPPISPKTSPTSLWKSLGPKIWREILVKFVACHVFQGLSVRSGKIFVANFTGRGCGGVNSFDSTPIHSQQYSCIKSVNQNKFCNYARRTKKIRRFLFHEAQKRDSQNRETPESLQGKKQQKHVCLVAFQTQTQNRSVLATLLPKSQQLRNFPNRNPAPGVSSKTQFQIAHRS